MNDANEPAVQRPASDADREQVETSVTRAMLYPLFLFVAAPVLLLLAVKYVLGL
jgi:hypothetical protein